MARGQLARVEVRRAAILAYIRGYQRRHLGGSPSVAEIGEGVGMAASTVQYHLEAMEAEGRIRREPGRVRAIMLVPQAPVAAAEAEEEASFGPLRGMAPGLYQAAPVESEITR